VTENCCNDGTTFPIIRKVFNSGETPRGGRPALWAGRRANNPHSKTLACYESVIEALELLWIKDLSGSIWI
jgi:hypothetical protein